MGGFTLYKGEEPQGVLLHKRLAILFESGKIELPKITEAEIEDRSKRDSLSKALAIGQTGWFVTQCIARHAQGLIITELELATVAFAVVNVAIYFLWWKKPLGVQCSVPVYLLDEPKNKPEKVESVEKTGEFRLPGCIKCSCSADFSFRKFTIFETIRTSLKKIWTSVRARPIRVTIILALEWAALGILALVISIFGGILFTVSSPFVATARVSEVFKPDQTEDEKLASVTMFYSIQEEDTPDNLTPFVTMIIASIFGWLHCAGWFFTYPSHAEKLIWRICSTFTAVLPWAMIITKMFLDDQEKDDSIDSWACIMRVLDTPHSSAGHDSMRRPVHHRPTSSLGRGFCRPPIPSPSSSYSGRMDRVPGHLFDAFIFFFIIEPPIHVLSVDKDRKTGVEVADGGVPRQLRCKKISNSLAAKIFLKVCSARRARSKNGKIWCFISKNWGLGEPCLLLGRLFLPSSIHVTCEMYTCECVPIKSTALQHSKPLCWFSSNTIARVKYE